LPAGRPHQPGPAAATISRKAGISPQASPIAEFLALTPPREPWRNPRCPCHPGEILKDSLATAGIKQESAADSLGITRQHLNRILNERADISIEMAFRLSRVVGSSVEFWLDLQRAHDLWKTWRRMGATFEGMAYMPEVERELDRPAYRD
jgi:addiction module HigA family antidote